MKQIQTTKPIILTLCFFTLAAFPCSHSDAAVDSHFKSVKGEDRGSVKMTPLMHGLELEFNVTGLPPGRHAVHFHENPRCEGPDFKGAGEHFAQKGESHGFNANGGPHIGDLPDIIVQEDGSARTLTVARGVNLSAGPRSVRNRTLIIHGAPDDYRSQPSGNSGDRIACAEIR